MLCLKKNKFKSKAPKKQRVASAQPKANNTVRPVDVKEYVETLYPRIHYDSSDLKFSGSHYQPWFKDFMKAAFDKENKLKYDMFIKRCKKTSPYNENSGYNYALLKRLAKLRSKSKKKNYQKNTIASIAKNL